METTKIKLSFNQALMGFLLPLATVLTLVIIGSDIVIAMAAALVVVAAFALIIGFKWKEVENGIMQGGLSVLGADLIMILVGMLIGVLMASGSVPTMLYYGMKMISPSIFLPFTFIICILTSLATGTSWGTAGTMGIALLGVAEGLGMPLPLVCGCILSGAIIGDKMSPLSETTLLSSASAGASLFDHIISMFYTTAPLVVIFTAVYAVMGLQYSDASLDMENINMLTSGLQSQFNISLLMLAPVLLVLILSIKKVPAFIVFAVGIIFTIIWALIFQNTTLSELLKVAVNGYSVDTEIDSLTSLLSRGGAMSMAHVVFASLMAGMFAGLLKALGILSVIMEKMRSFIRTPKQLIYTTAATCIALMLGGGGQYATLTLPGAAFRESYDEMDVHKSVLSRTTEDVGTMIDCIIPWTVSGIFYSGLFGVPVLTYLPFAFVALASPVMTIFNATFGFGVFAKNDKIKYNPMWRRKY